MVPQSGNWWEADLEAYLVSVRERMSHAHEMPTRKRWLHRFARKTMETLFMGGVFVYATMLLVVPMGFSFADGPTIMLEMLVWIPAYVIGVVWILHVLATGPPHSFRYSARMLWRNLLRWGTLDQWHH